eukprot:m.258938 g.258938  ORF g.258938 m.258938 type:complete len:75 (-) comp15971_c1_seq4:3767-3991(-)
MCAHEAAQSSRSITEPHLLTSGSSSWTPKATKEQGGKETSPLHNIMSLTILDYVWRLQFILPGKEIVVFEPPIR